MATQDDNNHDIELEKQGWVERVQQVMEDRRKESEGQGFGPRASKPFSAEWIKQQIVQPKKGATLEAKESYLPKEVNIHDILADMWSKDRRTQIRRSMQNMLEDYEPRPEKPFRSSPSDHQERSTSSIAKKETLMPLPQIPSNQARSTHLDDSPLGPQPMPSSTFVLSSTTSDVNNNNNNNNKMRSPANLEQGLAKATVSVSPPGSPPPVVQKRKRVNKSKPRRSTLRAKGPLQSIPEAHMGHSEGDEDGLGPSDEDNGTLVQEDDVDEPDLVEPEPEIHVSLAPVSEAHVSWVVSPRAKWEKEKAARKSSTPRSCKSPGDESTTRFSISEQAAYDPSPPISPAPPLPHSPLFRDSKQRWVAASPEMQNVIVLSRNLSDDSFPGVLRLEVEEDSNILVVPDSPSVSLESSDCDSNESLPEKEPLPLQEEVPESQSVKLESETSDSNEALEMEEPLKPELLTWCIVPDPAESRPRFLDDLHLKDQQPVVSKRKLSVDDISVSSSGMAPISPVNSEEGYLPLNDEEPIFFHKRKLSSRSLSSSSMPSLSPISSFGSETSSLVTSESRCESPKSEKKKKRSSKTKKEKKLRSASPKSPRASSKSPRKSSKSSRASITKISITEVTEKKEKKPTSNTTLSSSDPVSKVVEKKQKKIQSASITGAVPESTLEKKSEKKEKKPRRASISEPTLEPTSEKVEKRSQAMTVPAPPFEKVTEKREQKLHRASTETVAVPERLQRTTLQTVAAPEPTSVKSVDKKGKKPRIAPIQTTAVSDSTSDESSKEKEKKPRRSSLVSLKNTEVESSEKKGKSPKSKKEKMRLSKSSDKEIKKKARSKSSGPPGEPKKKNRSKSKTPKSPKKSKKTKKKSSKSKSNYERLCMSMPDLFEDSTNSETDFEQFTNLNASTGALSYATIQESSNADDLFYFINGMLSKPDSEQEQVKQDSSAYEVFYSTGSLLSPRSEPVGIVESQPVVSPSEQSMDVLSETSQLESTPITRDEKADANAPTEQPNSASQSALFSSAQMYFDMDAVDHEQAVEQEPESAERDKDVERTSSIELCSSNLEERELSRQGEGEVSVNELFYSARSLLSANGEEKDIKSHQSFAGEGSQDSVSCTSCGEPATPFESDPCAGIDMKGVQFLLGHLQVILCLDALMKYPNDDETSPDVLPPIEAKIRARWGLVNALGKTEEAKQAQEDFALHYGLLSTDVDELISHLRLCERTGADVRWDLVYQMVFPDSEIRWGVFDQILQPINSPTTHPDMESVEWSVDSLAQSEKGSIHEQGPTPTTDVPVKDNSLAALFSAAAAYPSNPNEVRGMARIEDEMEASEASSTAWRYANALLYDSQAQLAFRMEYDVTDEEFAAMLRYLSHCKATNTKVEWGKMEQVLCDVPEGVDAHDEVEDGSDSGSDHSSYCSVNEWNADSVAGESYFSVYPEHDDCASELTFYYDDRSVYKEDDMSFGSYSEHTYISEAFSEDPKEAAADNTNQNPLQIPDSTTDALRITHSSSFSRLARGPGRSSSFNGTRRRPGRSYSCNGPMGGPGRTSSFNGPRLGPGRTSWFNGPRRGHGPNSSFSGPRRGKRGMLFNRTPLGSIHDMHDSGTTAQSTVTSCSIGQSDGATAGSSSVATREPPTLLRRYHSASAALENLAEALVHQRAVF
jgi:hypothetical protein